MVEKNAPTALATAARFSVAPPYGPWVRPGDKRVGHGAAEGRTDPFYEGDFCE